jgi:hypothetical protein
MVNRKEKRRATSLFMLNQTRLGVNLNVDKDSLRVIIEERRGGRSVQVAEYA